MIICFISLLNERKTVYFPYLPPAGISLILPFVYLPTFLPFMLIPDCYFVHFHNFVGQVHAGWK